MSSTTLYTVLYSFNVTAPTAISTLSLHDALPIYELEFFNPFDETHPIKFRPKDKNVGPGYYRTPSLVSIWSSAPFLHRSEEHTSELQSHSDLVCRLLLEKKK